jgi:hypothetical protein
MPRFLFLVLIVLAVARPAAAQTTTFLCFPGLDLTAASGVPEDDEHNYRFQGICRLTYGSSPLSSESANVWTIALIRWRRSTGDYYESVEVKGALGSKSIAGKITKTMKCTGDPVVGSAACVPGQMKNDTNWSGFDRFQQSAVPIAGKAALAEATALSKGADRVAADNSLPPKKATVPPPKEPKDPQPLPTLRNATPSQESTRAAAPLQAAEPRTDPRDRRESGREGDEIHLRAGVRIALDTGRVLAARNESGQLRWALVAANDTLMQIFPAGARAYRNSKGDVLVAWSGGNQHVGAEQRRR